MPCANGSQPADPPRFVSSHQWTGFLDNRSNARRWHPRTELAADPARAPGHARSLVEIAITAVPFVLLWIAAWMCLRWSYLLSLTVAVPAAGFLVRLFMIQHDCGHGSFFRQRLANDWVGRVIGVLTLTPYDSWRRSHAVHHASSGNLERPVASATSPR
jgi:fatty acid desaturase